MTATYPPVQKPYTRNGEVLQPGVFPAGMRRVALGIEYDGSGFHGFQRQKSGVASVQQSLEQALSRVADEAVTLVCAGRTDAGVHACGQVIHFDTLSLRPEKAWTMGVNAHLPDTVSVRWAVPVSEYFHARFSATHRAYRYVIYNAPTRPGLAFSQLTWVREPLDVEAMNEAAQSLVGEHDFSSFRASQCQAKSPVRDVHSIRWVRQGQLVIMEVIANAFLHHMVRNFVGVFLPIGRGEQAISWLSDVLCAADRSKAGVTAPPHGLYLVDVGYPSRFGLPKPDLPGPWFLQCRLGAMRDGAD